MSEQETATRPVGPGMPPPAPESWAEAQAESRRRDYFAEYCGRWMPGYLKEGAPPPATWNGSETAWTSVRDDAREAWLARAALDFASTIAVRKLTPSEAVEKMVAEGSTQNVATGEAIRPAPTTLSEDLMRQADSALRAIAQNGGEGKLGIPGQLIVNLESAARGSWKGDVGSVESSVQAVKDAITAAKAGVKPRGGAYA